MPLRQPIHALHVAPAVAFLLASAASGSFTVYGNVSSWRTAVGGPTVQRLAGDYYNSQGESVDPEVWSDVGVHLASSGPLAATIFPGSGPAIYSQIGQTFEVRWDQPITALWYRAQTPGGAVVFHHGDEYVGWMGQGNLGITSTVAFDRMIISFPGSTNYGFLWNLEWGVPVPGPGASALLALGIGASARSRRRY